MPAFKKASMEHMKQLVNQCKVMSRNTRRTSSTDGIHGAFACFFPYVTKIPYLPINSIKFLSSLHLTTYLSGENSTLHRKNANALYITVRVPFNIRIALFASAVEHSITKIILRHKTMDIIMAHRLASLSMATASF